MSHFGASGATFKWQKEENIFLFLTLTVTITCEQGLIFIPNGGGSLGQHRVNIVDCTDLENGALAKNIIPNQKKARAKSFRNLHQDHQYQ